jgi:hypothetical protein
MAGNIGKEVAETLYLAKKINKKSSPPVVLILALSRSLALVERWEVRMACNTALDGLEFLETYWNGFGKDFAHFVTQPPTERRGQVGAVASSKQGSNLPNPFSRTVSLFLTFTAKKFGCMYSQKFARPQSQFPHSCVCARFIYSHVRPTYFPAAEYEDQSEEYINRSQKHECRNWDCSRAVPFLGIFASNFQSCVFAVLF